MIIQIGLNILQKMDSEQEISDSFNESFKSNEITGQLDVDYTADLTPQDFLQVTEELLKGVQMPSITEYTKTLLICKFSNNWF